MYNYHIDTMFLIKALSVLICPKNSTSFMKIKEDELLSALEFCNLLLISDVILYDGKVHIDTKNKIKEQLENAEKLIDDDAYKILCSKLVPLIPSSKCLEGEWIKNSISDSMSYFDVISSCSDILKKCISNYAEEELFVKNGMSVIEPYFTKKVLHEDLQNILTSNNLFGRRFFYGLLSEQEVFDRIAKAKKTGQLTDDVLRVMFARFRIDFAKHRSANAKVLVNSLKGKTAYYYPSFKRRKLLYTLGQQTREFPECDYKDYKDKIRGMKVYSLKKQDEMSLFCEQSQIMPLALKPVLLDKDYIDNKTGLSLLTASLRYSVEKPSKLKEILQATNEFNSLNNKDKRECVDLIEIYLRIPKLKNLRNKSAMKILLGSLWDFCWGKTDELVKKPLEFYKHIRHFNSSVMQTAIHNAEVLRYFIYSKEDCDKLVETFGKSMLGLMDNYLDKRFI
jgi:hypothetical protein